VTPDRDWGAYAEFAIGDGDSAIGISRNSESDFEARRSGSHGELLQLGILLLGWLLGETMWFRLNPVARKICGTGSILRTSNKTSAFDK